MEPHDLNNGETPPRTSCNKRAQWLSLRVNITLLS